MNKEYGYIRLMERFNRNSIPGKHSLKIDNNTYAIKEDNTIHVKFHDTIISSLYQDKIILNSGGYKTYTTKERLNHILADNYTGLSLYQVNHIWWIYSRNNDKYKFLDYMELRNYIHDKTGKICWKVLNYGVDNTKELNQLKYKITKYVNNLWKEFQEGKIGPPDNSNCLDCHFNLDNQDHLLMHIQEGYYPGYLIYNAWNKYPYSILCHDLMVSWINQDHDNFTWLLNIVGYQLKKSIYKYMVDNLISSG